MVARLMTAQEPVKLTQQNHPENIIPPEKEPTLTLGSSATSTWLCDECRIMATTMMPPECSKSSTWSPWRT